MTSPHAPMGDSNEAGVAGAYDRWATSYDSDRNATRDLDALVMREGPLDVRGRDVLELGCGTGKNTVWLAEHARSIVALDFSSGMLARARERLASARALRVGFGAPATDDASVEMASVRFEQHDVRERWPVADASVDAVVGNLVLEHVEDLAPIYAEASRVLRPGGELFLCELHPERQRRGGQAHFTETDSGDTIRVAAHRHAVPDYVNGGIGVGLVLRHLGEWLEAGAPADAAPRLLSVLFAKAAG